MAVRVGFEPTEPFSSPPFQDGAIDHSAILLLEEAVGFEPTDLFLGRLISSQLQ